jgi:hypothetical protein
MPCAHCPHCGQKTTFPCAAEFDWIDVGRFTCEHCEQEIALGCAVFCFYIFKYRYYSGDLPYFLQRFGRIDDLTVRTHGKPDIAEGGEVRVGSLRGDPERFVP